ncbi:MAG: lipoyl synthase [Planctomycetia bacterium]|nr:lipoyl synthase [Planctomycetia bacterium]
MKNDGPETCAPETDAGVRVRTAGVLSDLNLATVCDAAMCPNRNDCYARHTATFLLLGTRCTRNCPFCGVRTTNDDAPPDAPDPGEPQRVAEAVRRLGLRHVVLTCVTRDDLVDGGAEHFVRTIRAIRSLSTPATPISVEVLPSDFNGKDDAIATLAAEAPEVYAYNVETVPRLFPVVRDPRASYRTTLHVFDVVRRISPETPLKTGFLIGVGETVDELRETWTDLLRHGVTRLTIGQYLRPGRGNLPVSRYYSPEEFRYLEELAKKTGFEYVRAGRLVRSSYRAEEMIGATSDHAGDQIGVEPAPEK